MTGTKQLPGHFYRLLALLRQMLNRGRPIPTNSTGKKPLPGSITWSKRPLSQALASKASLPQPSSFACAPARFPARRPAKRSNFSKWVKMARAAPFLKASLIPCCSPAGRAVCGHAGQDHLARSDDIRQALFAFHLAIFPGCSLAKRPGLESG
jgi:hypothetical protein